MSGELLKLDVSARKGNGRILVTDERNPNKGETSWLAQLWRGGTFAGLGSLTLAKERPSVEARNTAAKMWQRLVGVITGKSIAVIKEVSVGSSSYVEPGTANRQGLGTALVYAGMSEFSDKDIARSDVLESDEARRGWLTALGFAEVPVAALQKPDHVRYEATVGVVLDRAFDLLNLGTAEGGVPEPPPEYHRHF